MIRIFLFQLICLFSWSVAEAEISKGNVLQTEMVSNVDELVRSKEGFTVKELQDKLEFAKNMNGVSELEKKQLTDAWASAIRFKERQLQSEEQTKVFEAFLEKGPSQLLEYRKKERHPHWMTKEEILKLAESMDTQKVIQNLNKLSSESLDIDQELKNVEYALEKARSRPSALENLLESLEKQLAEIESNVSNSRNKGKGTIDEAQHIAQYCRKQALLQEQMLYRRERLTLELNLSLLTAKRDQLLAFSRQLNEVVSVWSSISLDKKREDAERSREQAEKTAERSRYLPSILQKAADLNLELVKEVEEMAKEERNVSDQLHKLQEEVKSLDQDYEEFHKHIEISGTTETVGLMLSKRLQTLSMTSRQVNTSASLRDAMRRANARQFQLEQKIKNFPEVKDVLNKASDEFGNERNFFIVEETNKILETQRDLLNQLVIYYGRQFRLLGDLDQTQSLLMIKGDQMKEFINKNLLWARNVPLLGMSSQIDDMSWSEQWISGIRQFYKLPWMKLVSFRNYSGPKLPLTA